MDTAPKEHKRMTVRGHVTRGAYRDSIINNTTLSPSFTRSTDLTIMKKHYESYQDSAMATKL